MNNPSDRPDLLKKPDLLGYLAGVEDADAPEVARAFLLHYSVAAMALLRLVRQGLAERFRQTERGIYRYRLSHRGRARLQYLQQAGRMGGMRVDAKVAGD